MRLKLDGRIVTAIVVTILFLLLMVTAQVSYYEAAVVTTFGRADKDSVIYGNATDSGVLGNLHLRMPWPIQELHRFDLRVQLLEDRLEEQQTLDRQSVVVHTYLTWRVEDPLDFYRTLVTVEQAETQLRSLLRDARSVIGEYTFEQLTNSNPEELKLGEIEDSIADKLRETLDARDRGGRSWGVGIDDVGIQRLVLPQAVTERVFERMRATRQSLAQRARSEGEARAVDIVESARSARSTILAFADRRAESIRAEGRAAAAAYYEVFEEAPELAIFLRKLETYEEVLGNQTTFVFDTKNGLFGELANGIGGASSGGSESAADDERKEEGTEEKDRSNKEPRRERQKGEDDRGDDRGGAESAEEEGDRSNQEPRKEQQKKEDDRGGAESAEDAKDGQESGERKVDGGNEKTPESGTPEPTKKAEDNESRDDDQSFHETLRPLCALRASALPSSLHLGVTTTSPATRSASALPSSFHLRVTHTPSPHQSVSALPSSLPTVSTTTDEKSDRSGSQEARNEHPQSRTQTLRPLCALRASALPSSLHLGVTPTPSPHRSASALPSSHHRRSTTAESSPSALLS